MNLIETNNSLFINRETAIQNFDILKEQPRKLEEVKPKARSSFQLNGLILNYQDALTSTDPSDVWFFSTSTAKTMIARMLSSNPNYVLHLYVVDYATGLAYPTSIYTPARQDVTLIDNLPAGDYAFFVYSNGTVGTQYTIQLNATNPPNATTFNITQSLAYFVAGYGNGNVYINGKYLLNLDAQNDQLNWSRMSGVFPGGSYAQRTQDIGNVHVLKVSSPLVYSSEYASSNYAIAAYLKPGTIYTQFYSSNLSGVYEVSFADHFGFKTPRTLTALDFAVDDHALIVDINSGKSIDLCSSLNFYYAQGIERFPTVQYLE